MGSPSAPLDFDAIPRPQLPGEADLGADELGGAEIFGDGFETGDISRWDASTGTGV